MDRLVNTALTAMRGAMARQASIANNLANANTVGFRAEIANAETRWIKGDTFDTRAQASEQVIAADALGTQAIGPFALPGAEAGAIPVTITLAGPDYPAQDLQLRFDAVRVSSRPEAAP